MFTIISESAWADLPEPHFHPLPHPMRNDRQRQCGLQHWAYLADRVPPPRIQTMTDFCLKLPAGALLLTHPNSPPGTVFDVGAEVVGEVALNLDLCRAD